MDNSNTGGPAFPGEKNVRFGQSNDCNEGMTLRDYFAAKAPTNEVQDLMYRHLSRDAQEALTGLRCPYSPPATASREENVAFQLAEFRFKCAVNVAIRLELADAMLRARTQKD